MPDAPQTPGTVLVSIFCQVIHGRRCLKAYAPQPPPGELSPPLTVFETNEGFS